MSNRAVTAIRQVAFIKLEDLLPHALIKAGIVRTLDDAAAYLTKHEVHAFLGTQPDHDSVAVSLVTATERTP